MSKPPGLRRATNKSAYYYFRRIPSDIQHHFKNRQQLTIPLNTTEYPVAVERAKTTAVEVDAQFKAARLGVVTPKEKSGVVHHQLVQMARLHLYQREEQAEAKTSWTIDDEIELSVILRELEGPREEWAGGIERCSTEIATRCKIAIGPGDINWVTFVNLMHRAELESATRNLGRAQRKNVGRSYDTMFSEVELSKPAPSVASTEGVTIQQLIGRFQSDPTRAHLTDSAGRKYIVPFAALREIVGDNQLVREVTRAQCAEIVEVMAALPLNYAKRREFAGKTLREIVELAGKSGMRRISPGTVEVYVHHLSAFFNYAFDKGVVEANPASRLRPPTSQKSQKRVPFNGEELNALLTVLPAWCDHKKNGRFWLPLIALFTGMRLGEIIWLHRREIKTVDGELCFVLEVSDERSLKTVGSARTVPVHPTLLAYGFEQYVDGVSPDQRLFGTLPGDNQKHAVDLFQKRFSYLVGRQLNFRKGVSFHSFRHNFRDATRNAGAPMDVVRALGGWGRGGSIEERYGQGTRASVLAAWMAKIGYPDLDLGPLASFLQKEVRVKAT